MKKWNYFRGLWIKLNIKYSQRLIKQGYFVNNKQGDYLFSSYLLNFIMYVLYVIATFVVIWYDSSGPPSIAALIADFFVILSCISDRRLQKKTEISQYLEGHKAEIIHEYDILNKVRDGQIRNLCTMATVYAAGFLGYLIVVYGDKVDTDSIQWLLFFMKMLLTFSIIATLYDKWRTMNEGVFCAFPSSYIRQ